MLRCLSAVIVTVALAGTGCASKRPYASSVTGVRSRSAASPSGKEANRSSATEKMRNAIDALRDRLRQERRSAASSLQNRTAGAVGTTGRGESRVVRADEPARSEPPNAASSSSNTIHNGSTRQPASSPAAHVGARRLVIEAAVPWLAAAGLAALTVLLLMRQLTRRSTQNGA